MTGLGRWLAGILNAHIGRDEPTAEPAPDTPLARHYIGQLDAEDDEPEALHGGGITPFQLGGMTVDEAAQRLRDNLDRIAGKMVRPQADRYEAASGQLSVGQIEETWRRAGAAPPTVRPCWACGDPVGFHIEHLPCWKVAPFTRNPPAPWVRQP